MQNDLLALLSLGFVVGDGIVQFGKYYKFITFLISWAVMTLLTAERIAKLVFIARGNQLAMEKRLINFNP